jgi:membrane fusion protein, multidrug efflux system
VEPTLRILAFTASALALAGCSKPPPPAFERPPAPVVVAQALAQDVPVYLDELGQCAASELVSLKPQVSGTVVALHFADGAELERGQLLVSLDPRPSEARVAAAQAASSQSQAQLGLARTELGRVESLAQSHVLSQAELDERRSAVAVAEAQAKRDEAELAEARLELEYAAIHSPIGGRAGQHRVDGGNVVEANETELVTIQRLDPIFADFTITEDDLTSVQRHLARGPLRVEVRLPDDGANPLAGELTFLDSSVESSTGTVRMRATLANAERRLWPGRFVKVRLVLDTLPSAVLVPASAPQTSANGEFVYVVNDDSVAELRMIERGQRQGELLVVKSGVQVGERVVVEGHLGVTPGGKVRIDTQAVAAPGAPPASEAGSPAPPPPNGGKVAEGGR